MKSSRFTIARILLALYAALMLYLLFVQRIGNLDFDTPYIDQVVSHLNPIPFQTIVTYLRALSGSASQVRGAVINLGGNVGMFLPLGALLPAAFGSLRRLGRTVLLSFILLFIVETLQLFTTLGYFDVDDLILNLIGVLIGYAMWRGFVRITARS